MAKAPIATKFNVMKQGMDFTINHTNRRGYWIEGRYRYTLGELEQLRAAIDVALLKEKGKDGDRDSSD